VNIDVKQMKDMKAQEGNVKCSLTTGKARLIAKEHTYELTSTLHTYDGLYSIMSSMCYFVSK